MHNYKIMFKSTSIPEEEINQYKNFDALLAQKDLYARKNKFKNWTWGTLGLVVGLATIAYVGLQVYPEKAQPQKAEQSTYQPTPHSPSLKAEVKRDLSKQSKAGVVPKPKLSPSLQSSKAYKVADPNGAGFVEANPIGGYEKLYEYLRDNCKYPDSLVHTGINGTVLVQFTINKKGDAEQISVIKHLHPALDQEAIKAVAQMPLWTPASIDGKPLDTKLTLPLTFQNK